MPRELTTYTATLPRYETISKYPEYWKLVHWHASPTPLREPKTLRELAKQLSVHFTTLSRWAAVEGFYADVRAEVKKGLRNDLPDVFYALRSKIFKEGSSREVKLFLQWVDDFVEKSEVKNTTPEQSNPLFDQLVKEFEEKLRATIQRGDK